MLSSPGVTAPRQILPGTSYLVTRRCSERRPFLVPSPKLNDLFLYILAAAARRCGIQLHSYCVLSNHFHLVLTDPLARLPEFMQYLDSLVARSVNLLRGRSEVFWAKPSGYSAVTPIDPGDVLAKCAYVLANPVAAGLVRTGAEWPGLWAAPALVGGASLVLRRPEIFFSDSGSMPESVELELVHPPQFASGAEFRAALSMAVDELEAERRRDIESSGRTFLGVARVLSQDPLAWPALRKPGFRLNPRIAARDKWKRMEAISRMKTFVQEYRHALQAWCAGVRDVVFPAGTYQLRVPHGARCAGAA
jgi:REP element-mobilizing transposase RayT